MPAANGTARRRVRPCPSCEGVTGGRPGSRCAACKRALAHLDARKGRGPGRTVRGLRPPPELLETLLHQYEARAAAGLDLFGPG
jgi:hypothetical protein